MPLQDAVLVRRLAHARVLLQGIERGTQRHQRARARHRLCVAQQLIEVHLDALIDIVRHECAVGGVQRAVVRERAEVHAKLPTHRRDGVAFEPRDNTATMSI